MAQKRVTEYLQGKIYWAKIFGNPRLNYQEDGREWAFEFEPDEEGRVTISEHGLADRLRDGRKKDGTMRKGYEDRATFLDLRRKEFKTDGDRNEHIRVVDAANQAWPDKGALIGNETVADVKVAIVDYGAGKKKGIYPQAIRVLELVPYEATEFKPLAEDDPHVVAAKAKADTFRKDFGLNEDDEPVKEESEPEGDSIPETDTTPATAPDLDDEVPV